MPISLKTQMIPMSCRQIADKIASELDAAYAKHGNLQWSRHEFYAVLKEEVDELWDVIKKDRSEDELVSEAVQVAAMVFRFLETGDRNQRSP